VNRLVSVLPHWSERVSEEVVPRWPRPSTPSRSEAEACSRPPSTCDCQILKSHLTAHVLGILKRGCATGTQGRLQGFVTGFGGLERFNRRCRIVLVNDGYQDTSHQKKGVLIRENKFADSKPKWYSVF
jgi:hypothetical protein